MAKQTFTTGQVLTAAQMTSLQETAMGGGPATAKTALYVLVAADAGTTVAMNAAGATTITVNTGLFAAGDTVFIQNLGAGACTVTAGTATVATAGSLILPQNDAGILYFTATGAAIFYDYIQAGAVSPLTTKGDLYTFSTSDARLGVGANGTTLVANSSEATGLEWVTPTAGSFTQLASANLPTGASTVTISGIDGSYRDLRLLVRDVNCGASPTRLGYRFNSDTGSNYYTINTFPATTTAADAVNRNFNFDENAVDTVSQLNLSNYIDTTTPKFFNRADFGANPSAVLTSSILFGSYNSTSAITSITIFDTDGNNFDAGNYILLGIK